MYVKFVVGCVVCDLVKGIFLFEFGIEVFDNLFWCCCLNDGDVVCE